MTVLLVDALIALIKMTDRGLTAVENVFRRQPTPRAVDGETRPAGAGTQPAQAAGTGGHPVRNTSELLGNAAAQLVWVYEDRAPAVVRELVDDLIDRAAQLRAEGD
jgi:hypothetical protein